MTYAMTLKNRFPIVLVLSLMGLQGCNGAGATSTGIDDGGGDTTPPVVDRSSSIPLDVSKVTPAQDNHPPIMHSTEFEEPVSLPIISTAGAEDAPFIPAGRDELYFFFAADVRQSPSYLIQNPVNGIWLSKRVGGVWEEPTLVWLQNPGSLALNGCPFVSGNELYFCTARVEYVGLNWFKAEEVAGEWKNWMIQSFDPTFQVGEFHIHEDKLYYHSELSGGLGGFDIWTLTWTDNQWANPENLSAVNSTGDESRPYLTPDGNEIWITRTVAGTPAIFRSKKVDGQWQEPELIVSQFAGEATLDAQGNLYFVHHFFENDVMIEVDIYVAYKK
jgi:hypothetical protein